MDRGEMVEAEVMEELRMCREEKDLLEQKLHVHLDRWTLDKIIFRDSLEETSRTQHLQEVEHAYQTAQTDLLLGLQQQKILVLKRKLESALEDKEFLEIQVFALQSQLQEDQKCLSSACHKIEEMTTMFRTKVASKSKKRALEAERKVHQLLRLLDYRQQNHKVEVEKLQAQHTSIVSKLKEEIHQWTSQNENLKVQQKQLNLDREELQARLQEGKDLAVEKENWTFERKAVQVILNERDALLAEKDLWVSHQRELEEVRDGLNVQKENWLSQLQQGEKAREKLKLKLELSNSQREEEVKALVRERDFVWSQMKNMEVDYVERLKKMSAQILQDRQEVERLKNEMQEVQEGNNEKMVEMTVLKLKGKRAEHLASDKQCSLEAELQQVHSQLEKMKEENSRLTDDAVRSGALLLELTSQSDSLRKQLDASLHKCQEERAAGATVKEGPEVLNADDDMNMDHEIYESQVEQATRMDQDVKSRTFKGLEELRRENENLRMLYAQLEVMYNETKKPGKVARNTKYRDQTSRNLKLELEAAAIHTPSDENLLCGSKSSKAERLRSGSENRRLTSSTNLSQKKSKADTGRLVTDEGNCLEPLSTSQRITRSSKRKLSDCKPPSQKRPRPPLAILSSNGTSSSKRGVQRSSSNGPFNDTEYNDSLTGTSNMMANLFSAAFSFPRLKDVQTPSSERSPLKSIH